MGTIIASPARIWIILACVIAATFFKLQASSNPVGDEDAKVIVENGNFVVYFHNNQIENGQDSNSSRFRIVYSPSGQLLAPRHHQPGLAEKWEYDLTTKDEVHLANETLSFDSKYMDQPFPFYTVTRKGKTEQHRLPWPENADFNFQSAAGDANGICLLIWGKKLSLNYFDRRVFGFPKSVTVGAPLINPGIVALPDVSNLVQVNGRYCFGWMRYDESKEKAEAVITTWKPSEEKAVDTALDEIADWNTWMSLAAVGDHICLVYHCRFQGEYPGFGRLVTVFRKIDATNGAAVPVN